MKGRFNWIGLMVLMMAAMVLAGPAAPAIGADTISMTVDGKAVVFNGPQPVIDYETGLSMIPLRTVAEAFGAEVSWDGSNAIIKKDGLYIVMPAGSKNPTVNGVTKYLDAPARVVNGYTYVPVRFISEVMNYRVEWDSDNYCINVFTGGGSTDKNLAVRLDDIYQMLVKMGCDVKLYKQEHHLYYYGNAPQLSKNENTIAKFEISQGEPNSFGFTINLYDDKHVKSQLDANGYDALAQTLKMILPTGYNEVIQKTKSIALNKEVNLTLDNRNIKIQDYPSRECIYIQIHMPLSGNAIGGKGGM